MKNNTAQPELLPASPAELIDDTPEKVTADLRKFNRAQAEVTKALAPLKLILRIADQAGVESAMEHMKKAKSVETLIEDKRKDLVKPWNNEVSRINDHAKGLIKDVPLEITRVKNLVLAFQVAEVTRLRDLRTENRKKQLLELGFEERPLVFVLGDIHVRIYDINRLEGPDWSDEMALVLSQIQKVKETKIEHLQNQADGAVFFGDMAGTAGIQEEIKELRSTPPPSIPRPATESLAGAKVKGASKVWTFEVTDASQVPREYLMIDETRIRKAIVAGNREIAGIRIFQKDSLSLR